MAAFQRFGILVLGVSAVGIVLFKLLAFFPDREFEERRMVMGPLLSTKAELAEVREKAGEFYIWRRGTPTWENVFAQYQQGSKWDRHIASKMSNAVSVGHSSTISMQTWIFLDQEDRLIDFELGTQ